MRDWLIIFLSCMAIGGAVTALVIRLGYEHGPFTWGDLAMGSAFLLGNFLLAGAVGRVRRGRR